MSELLFGVDHELESGRRGGGVALAHHTFEPVKDGLTNGVQSDLAGEGGKAAEQRRVRQGSSDVLESDLGRGAGEETVLGEGTKVVVKSNSENERDVLMRT